MNIVLIPSCLFGFSRNNVLAHFELFAIAAVTLTTFHKVWNTSGSKVLKFEIGLYSLADVDHRLMVRAW